MIDFASKLEAGDDAQALLKSISALLPRKLFKLTSANSDDKIFYILQHLEQIEKILKSL